MSDANSQLRSMEFVWLANFVGTPCLQFPVGYVDGVKGTGCVPVGMSALGEWGSEDALIAFGKLGERYLAEGLEGGRVRPAGWEDVLGERKEEEST